MRNVSQWQTFLPGKCLLSHSPILTGVDSERAVRKVLHMDFPLSFSIETNTIIFSEKNHPSKPTSVTPG